LQRSKEILIYTRKEKEKLKVVISGERDKISGYNLIIEQVVEFRDNCAVQECNRALKSEIVYQTYEKA